MKRVMLIGILSTGLFIAGCSDSGKKQAFEVPFDGKMEHVHGIGYAGKDNGLHFASHTGLKIYRDGEWLETSKNHNDYMGFNAVDDGFYTSGHPGEDSDLPNPIGIQRSADGGKSLDEIDFAGETDFHGMAVGFSSHDIFLMNPQKNSKLDQGFYRSVDNGDTWDEAAGAGLAGELLHLAIHPSDSNWVAAATSNGIYLSEDAGERFELISGDGTGTSVYFDEENLYFASFTSSPEMTKYTLSDASKEKVELPELNEDGPVYIAKNLQEEKVFAIYTIKGQAFISKDGMKSWEQILDNGHVIN
ncbi:hypothetical protein MST22_15350 [Virgibacillus halodenitrificans]|uniref:F510_1955 family glycosylhydrolase n=1 Tax=Virgibacillus halodenitrificans TaxID=1482 RepID=UPI001FB502A6|nr:hypothetical protein [Virgibacillus halodenitrificans]MCJ0932522.1 hypothetical protein [Virgibacillus halodenitrificans]